MSASPAATLRLAVDAANLVADRRGMGRIVRATLAVVLAAGDVELTLLARKRAARRALQDESPGAFVASEATAKHAYDVVWYPFNGMRFPARAPAVVMVHDVFAFTEPHRSRTARLREQRPIRRAAAEAACVLTTSQWNRAEIVRELGVSPARIRIIAPQPAAFWTPGAPDALPPQLAGKRFALLVGAGEKRKNAAFALAACAAALDPACEALAIVGTLDPAVRRQARTLRLEAGEIAASDGLLRALYRSARVVLVPSLAEGFGLVAVEAMACGAAVIASNASALPEACGDAALLLDPRDRAAWSAAIRTLFDDDAAVAALRARSAARFAGVDRAGPARETLALLRELATRPNTRPDVVDGG